MDTRGNREASKPDLQHGHLGTAEPVVRPARPKKKGWEKMYEGVRDGRPVLAVTVAATLVLALVTFYAGFPALAASVVPIDISGNNRCGALAAQSGGGQTWI